MIKTYKSAIERTFKCPFNRIVWKSISTFYWNLRHLPNNIRKWGVFVLNDRDWEGHWTLEALRIKCLAQHKSLCKFGSSTIYLKLAKEAKETAEIIERIQESRGGYYTKEEYERVYTKKKNSAKALYRLSDIRRNKDLELLSFNIKNVMSWWD